MKTTQGQLAQGSIATGDIKTLTPTLVQTRGPGVNPARVTSSSRMRSTDVVPQPINWEGQERVADSMERATNMLVNSAVQYQDRVDQLEADEAILEYRKRTREAFYGREDESGRLVDGYALLKNKEALDSYSAYNNRIDTEANEIIKGRSESVKAKMLLSIKRENEAARDRGINHNYSQLKSHEENIRNQGNLDLLADIEKNGTAPWANGSVQAHLAKVKDVGQRQADEEYLAKNTLFMTYNDARELSSGDVFNHNPAKSAYEQASKAFEKIRGVLSEDTENALQNWLQGKKDEAERDDAQQKNLYQKRELNELTRMAPALVADSLRGDGNPLLFNATVKDLRTKLADVTGAPDKIVDLVKTGIAEYVSTNGGVTLANKRDSAIKAYNSIVSNGADFTTGELVGLRDYIMFELPDKIESQMTKVDNQTLAQRDKMIAEAIANNTIKSLQLQETPPANMTPESMEKFYKQRDILENAKKGKMSNWRGDQLADYLTLFQAKEKMGELTQADINELQKASIDGFVQPGALAHFQEALGKQEALNGQKMPWQRKPDYKGVVVSIDNSKQQLTGLPLPIKPNTKKASKLLDYEKERSAFESLAALKIAEVKLAFDEAARLAFVEQKPFDANQWWNNYIDTVVNKGKPVNTSFWSQFKSQWKFDIFGGEAKDLPSGIK